MLEVPQDVTGRWWVSSHPVSIAEHAEVANDQTAVAGIGMKESIFSSIVISYSSAVVSPIQDLCCRALSHMRTKCKK